MPTIYNFEAKSIQNYILESSRLRDMIGASEQLEYLCCEEGLLDQVLNSLALDEAKVKFARRAGGTFQAFFLTEPDARRFQAAWTFCVQQLCPSLRFVQGIATAPSIKQAVVMADKKIKKDHNRLFPNLPLVGPLIARCPRTGQAAVSRDKELEERLDVITKQKREFHPSDKDALLIKKLSFNIPVAWPRNLEEEQTPGSGEQNLFPFLPENRFIGIIHADANNLGQLLKSVGDELLAQPNITVDNYAEFLRTFSEIIITAVVEAARQATIHVLYRETEQYYIMPARPLVLGGDDFTFLVRGDLAIHFTQYFLEEFEKISQTELTQFKIKYPQIDLPEQLTACAGIAYIKASQPFYQGYALAESLCKHAKIVSNEYKNKLVPSSLAFHRITTSIIDEYGVILKRELTIGDNIQATMQPYLVGNVIPKHPQKFPHLDNLLKLSTFLKIDEVSRGPIREFLSQLSLSREQAKGVMQRWHDNMKRKHQTVLLDEFNLLLDQLNCDSLTTIDSQNRTPIGDALSLINVSKGSNYVSTEISNS